MERKADQSQSSKTMRSMGISKAQKYVMQTGSLRHLPNNIDTKNILWFMVPLPQQSLHIV